MMPSRALYKAKGAGFGAAGKAKFRHVHLRKVAKKSGMYRVNKPSYKKSACDASFN